MPPRLANPKQKTYTKKRHKNPLNFHSTDAPPPTTNQKYNQIVYMHCESSAIFIIFCHTMLCMRVVSFLCIPYRRNSSFNCTPSPWIVLAYYTFTDTLELAILRSYTYSTQKANWIMKIYNVVLVCMNNRLKGSRGLKLGNQQNELMTNLGWFVNS